MQLTLHSTWESIPQRVRREKSAWRTHQRVLGTRRVAEDRAASESPKKSKHRTKPWRNHHTLWLPRRDDLAKQLKKQRSSWENTKCSKTQEETVEMEDWVRWYLLTIRSERHSLHLAAWMLLVTLTCLVFAFCSCCFVMWETRRVDAAGLAASLNALYHF